MGDESLTIKWKVSPEGVPGGLSVGAKPKSYARFKEVYFSARDVRKIDDLRELKIPFYPNFCPFEYQREAVLRMLGRFRGKGIFGDQVGLGKTVEVGMTIAEFAYRDAIKNVLLLCPSRLVFQWETEINEKFITHFNACVVTSIDDILTAEKEKKDGSVTVYIMAFDKICGSVLSLKFKLEKEVARLNKLNLAEKFAPKRSREYEVNVRKIAELNALNGKMDTQLNESYFAAFDIFYKGELNLSMMVIDEADALLAASSNRVLNIYKVAQHLSAWVPYRILMSATPIRRQLNDLYMLMKIVRPEQFADRRDFITNYCFNKQRINDFAGEQINNLKGVIDQLFTRSRLSGKSVTQSLRALTIEEVIKLNFDNFAKPSVQEKIREAVLYGLSYGENSEVKNILRQNFSAYDSTISTQNHFSRYVHQVFIAPPVQERPFSITPQKDKAFANYALELLSTEGGAEAEALKFSLLDFTIPPKQGHLILYKGDTEDLETVFHNRESRRVMAELGLDVSAPNYDSYLDDQVLCEGKFSEFDRLVNGLLSNEKVVVFSDNDAVREQFIKIVGNRALNAKGDNHGENYFKFKSDDARYANAVYFAVNGQEKGVNMQFCNNLIIANLSSDPNLVEQIVGRISRINQKKDMNIYVFAHVDSFQHYLYNFYNDVLKLFSTWDGDNTFIVGGAVAAFLDSNPALRDTLLVEIIRGTTEDGEDMEIGFSTITEYIAKLYENDVSRGLTQGRLQDNALWKQLTLYVQQSTAAFARLVQEFGEQEILTADASFTDI